MSELTVPQYAVVKQLRIPVAVVITFRIRGLGLGAQIRYFLGHVHVTNSAEAACTAASALQSLVSSSSDAEKKVTWELGPDWFEYSGRRVLQTRRVITCTFGAAVVVEATNTKGIAHRNLRKTELSELYTAVYRNSIPEG